MILNVPKYYTCESSFILKNATSILGKICLAALAKKHKHQRFIYLERWIQDGWIGGQLASDVEPASSVWRQEVL